MSKLIAGVTMMLAAAAAALLFTVWLQDREEAAAAPPSTLPEWRIDDGDPIMPNLTGLNREVALAALRSAGIDTTEITFVERDSAEPSGIVLEQDIAPGTEDPGRIELTVSDQVLNAPDVVGLSISQARAVLANLGVPAALVYMEPYPSAADPDAVIAQRPAAGSPIDGVVWLTYNAPSTMPDLLGLAVGNAESRLDNLGVRAQIAEVFVPDTPGGLVLSQSPAEGEPIPSEVVLEVSVEPGRLLLTDIRALSSRDCSIRSQSLAGQAFEESLRCRTASDDSTPPFLEYNLAGDFQQLQMTLGIDDNSPNAGTGFIIVSVDGRIVESFEATSSRPQLVTIDVDGGIRLRIDFTAVTPDGDTIYMSLGDPALLAAPDVVAGYR